MWKAILDALGQSAKPLAHGFWYQCIYAFNFFVFAIVIFGAKKYDQAPLNPVLPAQWNYHWNLAATTYCASGRTVYLLDKDGQIPEATEWTEDALDSPRRPVFWQLTNWAMLIAVQAIIFWIPIVIDAFIVEKTSIQKILDQFLAIAKIDGIEEHNKKRDQLIQDFDDALSDKGWLNRIGMLHYRSATHFLFFLASVANIWYSTIFLSKENPAVPWFISLLKEGPALLVDNKKTFFPSAIGCDFFRPTPGNLQCESFLCSVPVHRLYFMAEIFIHLFSLAIAVGIFTVHFLPSLMHLSLMSQIRFLRRVLRDSTITPPIDDAILFKFLNIGLKNSGYYIIFMIHSQNGKAAAQEILENIYTVYANRMEKIYTALDPTASRCDDPKTK